MPSEYDALLTHPQAASPYDALLSHPTVSSPVVSTSPADSSDFAYPPDIQPSVPNPRMDEKPEVKSSPLSEQAKAIPTTARQTLAETGLRTAAGEEFSRAKAQGRLAKEASIGLTGPSGFTMPKTEEERKARVAGTKESVRLATEPALASAKDFAEQADSTSEGQPKGALTTITKGLTKGAAMAAEAAVGGIPIMATQGATEAYGAAKSSGKSDEEADTDAAKTLIGLAIFGGANKVVSSGITKLLGANPQALRTFLIQSLGQSAGNEATSRVISAGEAALSAPPGKRMEAAAKAAKEFNLEATAQNIGFGVMGGAHSSGEAKARIAETKKGVGPVVSQNEFQSIPDDQFDAAIQQFKKLPDSDPRKSEFEAEIARRAAIVQQGATETSTPIAPETAAKQPPSQVQQVPLSEGVASEESDPMEAFKQRRKQASDALAKTAAEAAQNPDTQQAAQAAAESVPIIEQKGGETVEKEQTEKRKEEGILTPESGEAVPSPEPETKKPLSYKIPSRAEAAGDKLVPVDIGAFDPAFQKDKGFYVGPQGEGAIPGRREGFQEFLKTGQPIEAPEVHVDDQGDVAFINGRHRYSVLRDQGEKSIPMAMSPESEANARKFGLIHGEDSQSGAVESPTATIEEPIAAKKAPAEAASSVEGERSVESPPRIVGPAIRGEDGTIITKGQIGDNHGKLKTDEIAKGNVEAADAEHVFHDDGGNILTRQEAAQRALETDQITQEQFDAAMRRGDTPRTEHLKGLHSEDLTKEETKADAPIEDHISSMLSLLGDEELAAKPEPAPTAAPEVHQQRTAEETIALLREELKTAPQRDKKGIRNRIAKLEAKPAAEKPQTAEEPAPTGNDTLDEMLRKEALFLKATEAKQGTKELWQQTRAEAEAEGKKGFTHMTAVKEAVKRGEAVPLEVLKDFSRYSWAREGNLTARPEKLSKGLMGLIEALKELRDEGEKPKRSKKGQEGSTIIPTEIAERVFSAGKFAYEKGMDAAAWAGRMVKAFGEKIRPFLAEAWNRIVEWNKQKGERGAIGDTGGSERKMGGERQAFINSVGKDPLRAALMAGKEMHEAGFEKPDVIKRMVDVFRSQMGDKPFDESTARRFFDPGAEVTPPKGEAAKPPEAKALPRYDDPGEPPTVKTSSSTSTADDTTALKKAVVNEQRQQRGEPEIPIPVRKSDEAMINAARQRMTEDPTAAETVISRIVDRGQKGITREDAALILAQRRATVNERNHWEDIAGSGTDAERLMARSKLDEIETRMDRLDHASRAAGSEWSDVGRMYQADLRADYSREALERKARAKTGRSLSREESAKIKEQAETIAKLQADAAAKAKEHQEAQQDSEVTRAYEATIKDLRKQLAEKGKPQKEVSAKAPLSKRIVQFVESQMDAARQRIKDRKGKMFADPLGVMSAIDLADHALIGAGHIVKGVVKFADWSKEMVKEFGKEIQPHLEPIYNAAKEQAKVMMKQAREKTPAEAKAAAKADAVAAEELSGKTVAALVRAHILAGVHGEDAVMKAVHADIREAYPDATERDVRRAYSDYGKVSFPNREAVATEMRELRVLTRLQESIDRETEGLSALHTGLQRDKATQSIREKQKTLNELLKKRSGDPSPEQLTSRDEAKQTALRNAIADLDKQLRTGEKPTERVPAADSPATEQLRAERNAMREKLAEIEAEANPPRSAAEKQIEQLSKIRARLDDILSGKKDKTKAPDWNPLSAEAETIKSEIDAMRELAAEMRPSSDAAQIKALEKSIDEYARRTAAKDFEPKGKKLGPDSAKVTALKEVRDSRRAMYDAVKKAGEPVRTPEEIYNERRMAQVQKQIAEAEARIKAGDFAPRPKPAPKAKFAATAKSEADLAAKKREITQGFERLKYENRSIPQKRLDDLKNALRFITAVKIIGHGTVGMVTHAGGLIWRPTKATTYWRNFGRQFGMWANKGFHERLIYELKNDPEFETWKNAGASIDPERTYTDYGIYAKWLGKLTAGGERGFDALKLTRLELNKSDWERVSPEIKADPEASAEMRKAIAAMNNKATGAIPRVNPLANDVEGGMHNLAKNPLADVALFAPKLYASRWARVVFDPVKTVKTFADWKSSSPAERQAATIKLRNAAEFAAVYAGGLLLNQAILSATGAQQNVNFKDPTKSDWLKFKGGGKEVIADGGLLDPIRLIGQIVWGDLIKNRTSNERYREGTRYEKVTHDLARYVRGKLNPTLGLAVDSATGSDFQGRPLPFSNEPPKFKDQPKFEWGEWLLKQGPIPLSGGVQIAYDAMREKGLSKPQIMDILKGAAVAVAGLTGAHISDEPKPSKQKPPRRSMVFSQ